MSRVDYLEMCKRVGIAPAPSPREWSTAIGAFFKSLGSIVYWYERAREYWWPDAEPDPGPMWPPEKMKRELDKERANCAKGKHWLGLEPDLTPSTRCAWGWCDFGKSEG